MAFIKKILLFSLVPLTTAIANCKAGGSADLESGLVSAQQSGGYQTVPSTLVDDSFQKQGGVYNMGVRKPGKYGYVCKKYGNNQDGDGSAGVNFQGENEFVFYVAPSDSFFGKECKPNPWGGDPTCEEIKDYCGKRIELTCNDPKKCGAPGELSMFSQMAATKWRDAKGQNSEDSYQDLVKYFQNRKMDINQIKVPRSIVLVINDFCPKNHKDNSGHCASPHVDVSNAAYLLYGKVDRSSNPSNNYIDPNVNVQVRFINDKTTPLGPRF